MHLFPNWTIDPKGVKLVFFLSVFSKSTTTTEPQTTLRALIPPGFSVRVHMIFKISFKFEFLWTFITLEFFFFYSAASLMLIHTWNGSKTLATDFTDMRLWARVPIHVGFKFSFIQKSSATKWAFKSMFVSMCF